MKFLTKVFWDAANMYIVFGTASHLDIRIHQKFNVLFILVIFKCTKIRMVFQI